ncbi:hypothetical protein FIBSPDRAFT_1001124 [Athelia psychrophila]|uniref:Ketoreductase (KR) domain-containing protein n=1 Tax=Athelia psychrophila TaxID=1759441 RepID=A0A167WYE6_9AGAM|nr:hypothetical protein FIBSPDRAFT_1001124 [Fibularhizoctonia sp. CBS 109695]
MSSITHTAGVIKDVVTSQLSPEPKANVVLLSSISVPSGDRGQAAYVAANSFFDGLAEHRRAIGLHGISLQLVVWESKMTEHLQHAFGHVWSHPGPTMVGNSSRYWRSSCVQHVLTEAVCEMLELKESTLDKQSVTFQRYSPLNGTKMHAYMTCNLADYGVDSIAFTQLAGLIATRLGRRIYNSTSVNTRIELPVVFLSDTSSLAYIVEHLWGRVRNDEKGGSGKAWRGTRESIVGRVTAD